MRPVTAEIQRTGLGGRALHSLQGRFEGNVCVLHVGKIALGRSLPVGLRVITEDNRTQTPVIVHLGRQLNIRPQLVGWGIPFARFQGYEEVLVSVPDVWMKRQDGREIGPFQFFPRVYLASWLPTLLGRWPYGWNKCIARFEQQGTETVVADRHGRELLKATAAGEGAAPMTVDQQDQLVDWSDQPVLFGRRGKYRSSQMRFDWTNAETTVGVRTVQLGQRMFIGIDGDESAIKPRECPSLTIGVDWQMDWRRDPEQIYPEVSCEQRDLVRVTRSPSVVAPS